MRWRVVETAVPGGSALSVLAHCFPARELAQFCKDRILAQSCPTLGDPMDYSSPGSSVHGILQARILQWAAMPSSKGSSQPRNRTRSPALQADSLPSEPPGKPKNTGVGSLSLLQGIFLSQELNWGLLHCRQILYQLSCQGNQRFRFLM